MSKLTKKERSRVKGLSRQVNRSIKWAECPECKDMVPVFGEGEFELMCINGHTFKFRGAPR